MDYVQYNFTIDQQKDALIGLCSTLAFNGFEEVETGFVAYLAKAETSPEIEAQLEEWSKAFDFQYTKTDLAAKNWNAEWEANFSPIIIDDFCAIRADFHPPIENVTHEIIITPKMAFGTGHHQTTHMMIEMMEKIDFKGKKVFDYGCGTGILAILAELEGADSIVAIDIEKEAYENTLFNAQTNSTTHIQSHQAILTDIPKGKQFDIILANINRNVILDSLPSLFNHLNLHGDLLISGFLSADETKMKAAINKHGFILACVKKKDNWLCFHLSK